MVLTKMTILCINIVLSKVISVRIEHSNRKVLCDVLLVNVLLEFYKLYDFITHVCSTPLLTCDPSSSNR